MRLALRAILAVVALGILMVASRAQTFKTLESAGVKQVYSARTSSTSSHTVSGFMVSWSVKAVGGGASFIIKHSSTSAGNLATGAETITSSTVYVLSGETVSEKVEAMVKNPLIHLDSIDTPGCTVYIDIGYLQQRAPGAF